MNAHVKAETLAAATVSAEASHSGLRSLVVTDKVARAIHLITASVVGFGATVAESALREHLESLGRADAHLVLEEIKDKGIVGSEFELLSPELHSLLVAKRRG